MQGTLVANAHFSAFGVDYQPGDAIDAAGWPEGAVERRLENKTAVIDFPPPPAVAADPTMADKTKAELVEMLTAQGVTLTGRESKPDLLKLLGEG